MTRLRGALDRVPPALVGVLALGVGVFLVLAVFLGWVHDALRPAGNEVTAEFVHGAQLQTGDDVRMEGKKEGRVTRIEPLPGARGSRVTMEVDKGSGPLYADARVQLRFKTLLGGGRFVAIDRGTPGAGELGDRTIPKARTSDQIEVDDVTSMIRANPRRGLRTMPGELADALADPAPVQRSLGVLGDIAPDAATALRAVRGRDVDDDLRALIAGAASATRALDSPTDELRTLIEGAAGTLQTTAARSAELRETLDRGPSATAQLRTTLARLDTTLGHADRLVAKLEEPADDVGPTLAALRPTLGTTDALLDDARPAVRALRPAVTSLAGASRRGVPLLDGLQPSLDRVDHSFLPFITRPDPETGKPMTTMIGGTASGFGGATTHQDGNGHFIRFLFLGGQTSLHIPCKTALINPDAKRLADCETLNQAIKSYLEYTPLQEKMQPGPKDPEAE